MFVKGGKTVLMRKWDAGRALKLIESEKVTGWTGVPTMVQDMMEHPDFDADKVKTLKGVGGGGAPTPPSQVSKSNQKFKSDPSQGYGLTETNGAVCSISGAAYLANPTSCGMPFPFVQACILDPDSSRVLPDGSIGELCFKGPLVMSHYWNKPKATDDAIVEAPGLGKGWFRSGDIGNIDEQGYVYIRDRAKDIIIRGGENISCAEVEGSFFAAASEFVMECAAFGIKDARLGEEVGVMVYLKPQTDISAPDLVERVVNTKLLAKFKVPLAKNVVFTRVPLPRGATGKILKRQIRDTVNKQLGSTRSKL
eukprot:TRINITY_DN16146_c0_g2_i1.p1 TRINITY_DN16146_c0_g2~~TRINITY_DN16146_c0_g2_i1.p1  ORF type:complete len:309 (-),score=64.82 TRINITY_DN16146_c0_g2_i1:143-1069(-)